MDKKFLEELLARGMSLEAIGEVTGKHPSTVSYWLKKHGLTAAGAARHAPKGSIDKGRLREMVEKGLSVRAMADELEVGYSTVRYWLKRLDLITERSVRRGEGERGGPQGGPRAGIYALPEAWPHGFLGAP